MKVLVISTSLRPGSFSERLATSFTEGARDAGHEAEFVSLKGKPLRFCTGCVRCQTTKRCMLNDSAPGNIHKNTPKRINYVFINQSLCVIC